MDERPRSSIFQARLNFRLSSDASKAVVIGQLRLLLTALAATALFCFCAVLSGRVAWLVPDEGAISFISQHYIHTIAPAMLVATLLVGLRARQTLLTNLLLLVVSLSLFCAVLFLHFNLKTWAPELHRAQFDGLYHAVDLKLAWLLRALAWFANPMRHLLMRVSPNPYHDVFVALFALTFLLAALRPQAEARILTLLTTTSLVLLVGGVLYSAAPALGPFLYGLSDDPSARSAQLDMLRFTQGYIASAGSSYSPQYFVAALGAMPSLHVANTFIFVWFAHRFCHRAWMLLYAPLFLYIAAEAVTLRWHYLVDLPAGIAVAALAIWLSGKATSLPRA